jgi:hypothetical protein
MMRHRLLWELWVAGSVVGGVAGLAPTVPRRADGAIFLTALLAVGLGVGLVQAIVLWRGWSISPWRVGLYLLATGLGLPVAWLVAGGGLAMVAYEALDRADPWAQVILTAFIAGGVGLGQGLALWGRRAAPLGGWVAVCALAGVGAVLLTKSVPGVAGTVPGWAWWLPVATVLAVYSGLTGLALTMLLSRHLQSQASLQWRLPHLKAGNVRWQWLSTSMTVVSPALIGCSLTT